MATLKTIFNANLESLPSVPCHAALLWLPPARRYLCHNGPEWVNESLHDSWLVLPSTGYLVQISVLHLACKDACRRNPRSHRSAVRGVF